MPPPPHHVNPPNPQPVPETETKATRPPKLAKPPGRPPKLPAARPDEVPALLMQQQLKPVGVCPPDHRFPNAPPAAPVMEDRADRPVEPPAPRYKKRVSSDDSAVAQALPAPLRNPPPKPELVNVPLKAEVKNPPVVPIQPPVPMRQPAPMGAPPPRVSRAPPPAVRRPPPVPVNAPAKQVANGDATAEIESKGPMGFVLLPDGSNIDVRIHLLIAFAGTLAFTCSGIYSATIQLDLVVCAGRKQLDIAF